MKERSEVTKKKDAARCKLWYKNNKERHKSNSRAYYNNNTPQCVKQSRAWYKANKDKRRAANIMRVYNMTIEQYLEMYTNQSGRCAICQKACKSQIDINAKRDEMLYVDHCHATNKNRGLLCHYCNTVLGMARDSVSVLINAIQYLKKGVK